MDATDRRVARNDHEATYLCMGRCDDEGPSFERIGVEYRTVADSKWGFAATLSRLDPDVTHAAGFDPGAALAARFSGVPLVLDWSGEDVPRTFGRALGAANAVLVPSAYVGTKVRECGVDATVILESVDRGRIRGIEPAGAAPESSGRDGWTTTPPLDRCCSRSRNCGIGGGVRP